MKAEHSLDPFTFAAGTDFEMASAFFLQKTRQLAAKISFLQTAYRHLLQVCGTEVLRCFGALF